MLHLLLPVLVGDGNNPLLPPPFPAPNSRSTLNFDYSL
jgi:hypothetical protein